jgi:hypothetical protein
MRVHVHFIGIDHRLIVVASSPAVSVQLKNINAVEIEEI